MATHNQVNLSLSGQSGTGSFAGTTSPVLTTPILGAASATSLSFSSTSEIIGTTTNNNAAAGSVGEFISQSIASGSAVAMTTGVSANIASISLTAGDWDVFANIWFNPAVGTLPTYLAGAINTTSATFPTAPNSGAVIQNRINYPAGLPQGHFVGKIRQSLSGTTTIYLIGYAEFTVSTLSIYGFIGARRIR